MSILCDPRAGRAIYNVTSNGLELAESDDTFCALMGWSREELASMDLREYRFAMDDRQDNNPGMRLEHSSGTVIMPRAAGGLSELAYESICYESEDGRKLFIAAQYASLLCHITP